MNLKIDIEYIEKIRLLKDLQQYGKNIRFMSMTNTHPTLKDIVGNCKKQLNSRAGTLKYNKNINLINNY